MIYPESFESSSPESKLCSVHIKEIQLAKLPKYFCFAINSQIWTQWGGLKSHQKWTYPGMKLQKSVAFFYSRYLDKVNLGPFMFYPPPTEVNYQLEALVVHYGESGFGHYFTLRKVDGVWYEVRFVKLNAPSPPKKNGPIKYFKSVTIVLYGKCKVKADWESDHHLFLCTSELIESIILTPLLLLYLLHCFLI